MAKPNRPSVGGWSSSVSASAKFQAVLKNFVEATGPARGLDHATCYNSVPVARLRSAQQALLRFNYRHSNMCLQQPQSTKFKGHSADAVAS